MTFSGCRAATRLLECCCISLHFKIYNVFLPMNVSALKYKNITFFLPFSIFGLAKISQEVYLFYIFKVSKSALSWRTIRLNIEFMEILKRIFVTISVTELEKSDQNFNYIQT